MFIDTAQKGQQLQCHYSSQSQLQLHHHQTITLTRARRWKKKYCYGPIPSPTSIADRLAGVSQFFYCNSLFIGGHQVPVAPQVPLHGADHEPAKIRRLGGLLLSCYVRAMVLPLCVTTLCIAIAFYIWVHEMRIQASSAERDSLLLCPYTVHRHCVGNWSQN